MSAPDQPPIDFAAKLALANRKPNTDATRQELEDAQTVLAALQDRPDWAHQPGELDQARALVNELAERHNAAETAANAARVEARQAAYAPAIAAANGHAERLAAEAPRLMGRLAELVAGLAQLAADTEEHQEQVRQLAAQRLGVIETARRHHETQLLPTVGSVRIPEVPRGDWLASPLSDLRRALKQFSG